MSSDNRRRKRVEAGFATELVVLGRPMLVTTVNLSLKGVLLQGVPEQESALAPGTGVLVRFNLKPEVVIEIEGEVARRDDDGLAVDFVEMEPDSFQHLHRLVQLNASDPDAVDADLARPAFDRE